MDDNESEDSSYTSFLNQLFCNTSVCYQYSLDGFCKRGNNCQYSHDHDTCTNFVSFVTHLLSHSPYNLQNPISTSSSFETSDETTDFSIQPIIDQTSTADIEIPIQPPQTSQTSISRSKVLFLKASAVLFLTAVISLCKFQFAVNFVQMLSDWVLEIPLQPPPSLSTNPITFSPKSGFLPSTKVLLSLLQFIKVFYSLTVIFYLLNFYNNHQNNSERKEKVFLLNAVNSHADMQSSYVTKG